MAMISFVGGAHTLFGIKVFAGLCYPQKLFMKIQQED